MPINLGPGGGYAIAGLVIAGITWAIETFVKPLGNLGRLAYAVAAILIIAWAVILLFSVLA